MSLLESNLRRRALLRQAVQYEWISCGWVIAEAAVGAWAALQAGSLAITAFSADSAIELISGVVLLTRLWMEYAGRLKSWHPFNERAASGVVSVCLFALAAYVAWQSGRSLAAHHTARATELGWGLAVASSLVTPWLAKQKHRLGQALHSHALLGDAACSLTCAYMAWTLLAGLALETWAPRWGWVDPLAALGIVYFALREAWESAAAAWSGEAHAHGHAHRA